MTDENRRVRVSLPNLGPCFASIDSGNIEECGYEYVLPSNYSQDRPIGICMFLPGGMGGQFGSVDDAMKLTKGLDLIAVSAPLFKSYQDRSEPCEGRYIGWSDIDVITTSYRVILSDLRSRFPNWDKSSSSIGGYSNGAITTAMLLTLGISEVSNAFSSYFFVEGGMLHLSDFQRQHFRSKRLLVLVGDSDEASYGIQYLADIRKPYLCAADLVQTLGNIHDVCVDVIQMEGVGHDCPPTAYDSIHAWLRQSNKAIQADAFGAADF